MSDKNLLKKMKRYTSKYTHLKNKTLSQKTYVEMEKISDLANEILRSFSHHNSPIDDNEAKIWIDFINTFGYSRKQDLLKKLQNRINFNIEEYMASKQKSFLDKIFPKKQKISYLSSNELKQKYNRYNFIAHDDLNAYFFKSSKTKELKRLKEEAIRYTEAIASGKIVPHQEDCVETKNYIEAICFPTTPIEKKAKDIVMQIYMNGPQQSQTVSNATVLPDKQQSSQKKSIFSKRISTKIKFGILSSIALIGSFLGIKSSNEKINSSEDMTIEVKKSKPNTTSEQISTAKWQNKQSSKVEQQSLKIEPQSTKVEQQKTDISTKEQNVWKNYYDNTIEILSSATQKEKLYKQIEQQLSAGIFKLPQDISKEKMAYSYVLYKEYGLSTSISQALTSKQRLTTQQQQKLEQEINAVGKKGEGVKKIAQQMYNGKLSSYSKFNDASSKLQQKHVKNLKELMQLKKQNQR